MKNPKVYYLLFVMTLCGVKSQDVIGFCPSPTPPGWPGCSPPADVPLLTFQSLLYDVDEAWRLPRIYHSVDYIADNDWDGHDQIVFMCTPVGPACFRYCASNEGKDDHFKATCWGDSVYQTDHPMNATLSETTHSCFCTHKYKWEIPSYSKDHEAFFPRYVPGAGTSMQFFNTSIRINLAYNNLPVEEVVLMSKRSHIDIPPTALYSASLEDERLKVLMSPEQEYHIIVRKEEYSDVFQLKKSVEYVDLPSFLFIKSGELVISFFIDGKKRDDYTLPITGRAVCRIKDCIICWDAMSNWSCLPTTYKFFFVAIMMLICVLIVSLLPVTIQIIVAMLRCCIQPLFLLIWLVTGLKRTKFSRDLRKGLAERFKKAKSYYLTPETDPESQDPTEVENSDETDILMNEIREENRNRKVVKSVTSGIKISNYGRAPMSTISVMMILCFTNVYADSYIDSEAHCTTGLTLSSQVTNCIKLSQTSEECVVGMEALFTVQKPGQTACFTLTDENNDPIARGYIKYEYVMDTISLATAYYTADWRGSYETNMRCRTAGACTGNNCENLNGLNDKTAYGELTGHEVVNFPGEVGCRDGPSGIPCFFPAPSCIFSAYGLVPQGAIHKVSRMSQRQRKPIAIIEIVDMEDNAYVSDTFAVGETQTVNGITFQLIGTFSGDMAEFEQKKILEDGTNTYLIEASDPGFPAQGNIGDIQASSTAALSTSGKNNFIFDPQVATKVLHSKSDQYTFKAAGIHTKTMYSKLPASIGGSIWNKDGNFFRSNTTDGGALAMRLFSQTAFKVVRTTNAVCPVATFLNATGCFNCEIGAVAYIKARSTCLVGGVLLKTDKEDEIILSTTSMSLSTTDAVHRIDFKTSVPYNDFNLMLVAYDTHILNVKFTAVEYVPLRNDTNQNGTKIDPTDSVGGSSFDWNSLWNWVNEIPAFFDRIIEGTGKWWEYIIFGAILLLGLVLMGGAFTILTNILSVPVKATAGLRQKAMELSRRAAQKTKTTKIK